MIDLYLPFLQYDNELKIGKIKKLTRPIIISYTFSTNEKTDKLNKWKTFAYNVNIE